MEIATDDSVRPMSLFMAGQLSEDPILKSTTPHLKYRCAIGQASRASRSRCSASMLAFGPVERPP